jgi:hypothetical protein
MLWLPWSRSTSWSGVIGEFSKREIDDAEFISFVESVFLEPTSRDAFLMTRNVNPYDVPNKININQSLFDDALETFMGNDYHVKAKQALIGLRLANLPEDQDGRVVVENLLKMAVERGDALSFVFILNRASAILNLEIDLANILSETGSKMVNNVDGTSVRQRLNLQESILTRIADLEDKIAENQDSLTAEKLTELKIELNRLKQFDGVFSGP